VSRYFYRMGWVLATVVVLAIAPRAMAGPAAYRSPVALVATPDGTRLYVAEHTANRVAVVDVETGAVTGHIALPASPTGLALSPTGNRLYVTAGLPNGRVYAYATDTLSRTGVFEAGHSPTAPVVGPGGARLYLCNRFGNEVLVLDTRNGARIASIPTSREPVAAAITPNGTKLVVANHLPAGAADGNYAASVVSIIDTTNNRVGATVQLPNGSNALKGVCLSPDGRYAYVTHVLARYQLPTTQLERGWMNTNALTVIDLDANTLVATVLLDNVDLGAANPWGVACTADGQRLCVAHAGTHEISVIDRPALHAKLDRLAAGEAVSDVSSTLEDVPTDLAFLVDIRRRVALPGKGPRGVVMVGQMAYAAQYFSDDLASVDLTTDRPGVKTLSLGPDIPMTQVRLGEFYAQDAGLCFQRWQSCASCHPDMRSDGLNWDLLNDGMGNPKNSKSLVLSHKTPPVMISGIRPDAETAVRAGIKYIQFAVRPEEDAQAIDAYLKSVVPTPSPQPADDAVRRGRAVFTKAECANCHSGSLYTDLTKYDVGTGIGRQADWCFDTPTLLEAWRTAPYLHDGRAATLDEVVGVCNPDDRHGITSNLTADERADLVAFLRSL